MTQQVCKAEDCNAAVPPRQGPGGKRLYCSHACGQRQKHRNQDRRERYGAHGSTLADYDRLFMEQAGCCAICGTTTPGGGKTRFAFDHDHATNKSRGLLCYLCNVGLGSFQDDPERLRNAISYLIAHMPGSHGINPPREPQTQGIYTPC